MSGHQFWISVWKKKNRISTNRWFRVFLKHQRIKKLPVRTGGFMGSYFTFEKEIQELQLLYDRTG
jgi:hypothetical protein